MKVLAKKDGYCQNTYRTKGSVFDIPDFKFSEVWMEKISSSTAQAGRARDETKSEGMFKKSKKGKKK